MRFIVGITFIAILWIMGWTAYVSFSDLSSNGMATGLRSSPVSEALLGSETRAEEQTQVQVKEENIKLLFGGDLMLDRHIRLSINKNGADFLLAPLKELFFSYDMVIANLEGPITTSPSRSVGSVPGSTNNFIFTFDPVVATMLKQHNFGAVSLANNHIRNFGVDGITETKSFLSEQGLPYLGYSGEEVSSSDRVRILEKNDKKLAFVGVNQFVMSGFDIGVEDIEYARPLADVVIVIPHWGNEYETVANEVIQHEAHRFIDSGADLIIGSHPHVVQQSEVYKGKTIYYSLGNFVFDQYFSPEVQKGLLVGVEIPPDGSMIFSEIPIQLKKGGQTDFAASAPVL